jgi:nucleoside phosphorylase
MSYIELNERTVFLHFLNREATEASGATRDWRVDLLALDLLTLSHCAKMSVNISQMLEYTIDRPNLVEPLSKLCKAGILVTTSHDKNFDDFLESRRIMYSNVAGRYPIYFNDTSLLSQFQIRQKNTFSMSAVLRRDILDISDRDDREPVLSLEQRHAHRDDWRVLADRIDEVQRVFGGNRHAAVTRGNLELMSSANSYSPRELSAIARVFSARYFDHYKRQTAAITCSGLGDNGFIDDHGLFPHYDIPILKAALGALSWHRAADTISEVRLQLYEAYGGRSHINFVQTFQSFLGACDAAARKTLNIAPDSLDYIASLRNAIIAHCTSLVYSVSAGEGVSLESIDRYFDWASEIVQRAVASGRSSSTVFDAKWEELMSARQSLRFLVLTATDTEDDALCDALGNAGYQRGGYISTTGQLLTTRWILGQASEVVHARSSAGSTGVSGSELVAAEAIKELKPNFVIAVGICFGLKPNEEAQKVLGRQTIDKGEQSLGDVLYADKVTDYETVRLCFENGEERPRERGPRVPVGGVLLDAARIVRGEYRTGQTKVFSGEFLSGLKLIDSPPAVDDLKNRFPDAVGGEMEATGIVAASSRHGVSWIVVKAICDWGYSKGKKEQKLAADNAAEFVLKMIRVIRDSSKR